MKFYRVILPMPLRQKLALRRLERIRRASANSYETRNWLERHNAQMEKEDG